MTGSELRAEIGIIGGTGIYDPLMMEDRREVKVYTPYGDPSDLINLGTYLRRRIAFIARHGRAHSIPPHRINYRANIWAMKELGVTRILAPSAVGSLRMEMAPGDMVVPDQFLDRTKSRPSTFYDGGQVCHISAADPFCEELRETIYQESTGLGYRTHKKATYVCIEGPRFSTRAESKMFREWGADIIGMTLVPECVLARETAICYATIATVTDYDVWAERPVSAAEVVETLHKNVEKTKKILSSVIPKLPSERRCSCKDALKGAIY